MMMMMMTTTTTTTTTTTVIRDSDDASDDGIQVLIVGACRVYKYIYIYPCFQCDPLMKFQACVWLTIESNGQPWKAILPVSMRPKGGGKGLCAMLQENWISTNKNAMEAGNH